MRTILIAFFLINSLFAFCQGNCKIAYTNLEFLVAQWPPIQKAEKEFEAFKEEEKEKMQSLYKEYYLLEDDFLKNEKTYKEETRKEKEKALRELYKSIKIQEKQLKMLFAQKKEEMLDPLMQQLLNTIGETAKSLGYEYVMNDQFAANSSYVILYSENKKDNITPMVMKKLGIQD